MIVGIETHVSCPVLDGEVEVENTCPFGLEKVDHRCDMCCLSKTIRVSSACYSDDGELLVNHESGSSRLEFSVKPST